MDVCVESVSDTKPTKSLAGMMQFWGRALRMKPEPAIFNDHVNNFIEHGFPDTEREWTLEDRPQSKRAASERTERMMQCVHCFYAHRPAPQCPNCGKMHEVKSREIEQLDGELHEMTKEQREAIKQEAIKQRKREQGAARTYEELLALGIKRNMSNPSGWAYMVLNSRRKYGTA